jgi:hypothetical protein
MTIRRIIATTGSLAVVAGLAFAPAPAEARSAEITLKALGTRYVDTGFPLKGTISGTGARNNKRVILQRRFGNEWVVVARLLRQDDGPYSFGRRSYSTPGTLTFRAVVRRAGNTLDVSPARSVVLVTKVPPPPPPPPPPPATDLLPDLGIKRLNDCSPAEKAKNTDGTCFSIHTTDVPGQRLLKFPATTFNVGTGPAVVKATRASSVATDWTPVQEITTDAGTTHQEPISATFFYAGDEHQHWHITDFDSYELLDSTDTVVQIGEKHGYCLQDNVSFRGWLDEKLADPSLHPGMPLQEVYTDDTACGFMQHDVTSIVHGLSVGWGDTYPTSLTNQAIDITDLPDGTYTVRVTANQGTDGTGILTESNSDNNSASSTIQISGDTVTWMSDDSGM